jgi:hypothetical protein
MPNPCLHHSPTTAVAAASLQLLLPCQIMIPSRSSAVTIEVPSPWHLPCLSLPILASPHWGTQKVSFSHTAPAIDCYCRYPPPPIFQGCHPPLSPPPHCLIIVLSSSVVIVSTTAVLPVALPPLPPGAPLCCHFHCLIWPNNNGGGGGREGKRGGRGGKGGGKGSSFSCIPIQIPIPQVRCQSHLIWEAGGSNAMVPRGTQEGIGALLLVGIFGTRGDNRIDAPV